MNHQVLASKWRPKNFEEMVGQEHVLRSLINGLNQNRLHSAYLFTGTRGVGKTTLGRILAKALSCKQGISATPCNQCQNCEAISKGQFPDFFEIDAASHTKVEDIRELLSNLPYAPIQGRFKIYLIDEVHMLSNHSFNALLKTLEEPPAHVVFIFATTDPERLPATIVSRCLQFCLKYLTPEQIETHLANILKKEQIPFEPSALPPIAMAARGSARDALTLLHQAIAYSHENLTAQDVCTLLGTLQTDHLLDLLEALKQQNANQLMALTQQLSEKTVDFQQLLQSLAALIHQLTLSKVAPGTANSTARLAELSEAFSLDELQKYYQILISGQQDLFLSPTPKMGADMTLLRMLAVNMVKTSKPSPNIAPPGTTTKQANTTPLPIQQAAPVQPMVETAQTSSKKKEKSHHPEATTNPSNTIDRSSDEQIKAIMKAFNAKLTQEKINP